MEFLLSKIYVFISQVNHEKRKVLPILYCLFICSQNNRRLHWCRGSWCSVGQQGGQGTIRLKNGMGNVTSALVDKTFASIISNKTRHYKVTARAVHSKSHMTQETEKTLKVLYSYGSYIQLNVQSLLLTSPTLVPTFKCLLHPKFDISGKQCFSCA